MGAKLSGGGGSKFHIEQNSDINVTPFVDIMLVLLIIFMVAAPMATVSVEVKLPTAVAKPAANPPSPIYVSIVKDGRFYIGDNEVDSSNMGEELKFQLRGKSPESVRIFIRADKGTRYGNFMQVMNILQDNGFYSVALIGEDGNK
jgi:biopolymer transport protein ExbD